MTHRRAFILAVLVASVSFAFAPAAFAQTTQPARPVPEIRRVMIVSIDGLRPDLALRADTPTIHGLVQQGSFTFWARTTAVSITLPSHTSMLTGVSPRKHGIEWNADLPLMHPIYPAFPTLFEQAHNAGYTTGMAAGKLKFDTLDKPGTIDWCYLPKTEPNLDGDVAKQAVQIIKEHKPDVMFVHLPNVDTVGHAIGWASKEQLAAIHDADAALGEVIHAAKDAGTWPETLLILTADHGGAGRTHGPDDPRSRHIPWIAVGPRVYKNLDLTTMADLEINTEDTFATCCYVLGLPLDHRLDGKPIEQAFDLQQQLLVNTPR